MRPARLLPCCRTTRRKTCAPPLSGFPSGSSCGRASATDRGVRLLGERPRSAQAQIVIVARTLGVPGLHDLTTDELLIPLTPCFDRHFSLLARPEAIFSPPQPP